MVVGYTEVKYAFNNASSSGLDRVVDIDGATDHMMLVISQI